MKNALKTRTGCYELIERDILFQLIKLHRMLYTALLEHTKPISRRCAHIIYRIIRLASPPSFLENLPKSRKLPRPSDSSYIIIIYTYTYLRSILYICVRYNPLPLFLYLLRLPIAMCFRVQIVLV